MQTHWLDAAQPAAIQAAAAFLRDGLPVVFPTDTLYGVGVDAFNPAAVARLYQAKGRPEEKGLPILLGDPADLERVVTSVPRLAAGLIRRFWPGPLTLVLPKQPTLPANLSPNDGVAVRLPDHPVARALIRAAGGAVAASSANRSGRPPAHDAPAALAALDGLVAAVLDGGPARYGLPSTIVDFTLSPPRLLRAGPLGQEIAALVGAPVA